MATGNWTDPNCGQLQLVVRSFAVGFSSVSVIFSVQWTGPANTKHINPGPEEGCEDAKARRHCVAQVSEATRWDLSSWSGGGTSLWVCCCGRMKQSLIEREGRNGLPYIWKWCGRGSHEFCRHQVDDKGGPESHWGSTRRAHETWVAYPQGGWQVSMGCPIENQWRWWWKGSGRPLFCHAKEHPRGQCDIASLHGCSYRRSHCHERGHFQKECGRP